MLHLYALADHPVQLPSVRGIDDSTLAAVEIDGIDAVLSSPAIGAREATQETILAHAGVVEQLTALNEAVLPARLGAAYASEATLADAIRRRAPQLQQALERVRGCTEMGLRVVRQPKTVETSTGSGGEYMRGRLEQIQEAERVAAEIREAVHPVARNSTQRVLASPQLLLSGAYLLPRTAVDSFRAAVETVEQARPELTFVCTGPWPPYSFALVDGNADEQG